MKRRFLLSTILGLVIISNVGSASAAVGSVQEWASQDAAQAVINRQPVNEGAVRQRGVEYSNAFLAGFAQASQVYEQAFRQGVSDGIRYRPATPPLGQVARAGYQRGYERGCLLRRSGTQAGETMGDHQELPSNNQETALEPDHDNYPVKSLTPDQEKFIRRIAKSAQKVGMECDLYPSVIIAQAALESNWGVSGLAQEPYHNLFGVKGAFNGHSVKQVTTEYTAEGKRITIKDNFRWYENDYQSLRDYAKTLADPLYEGVHRSQARNYRAATHALLGKYATDPHYDRKLNRLIDNYQLTEYDHQTTVNAKEEKITTPVADASGHESQATPVKHHHRLSWLSVAGGVGSAGALGLLRRFVSIK